jgi:serine protease Do
MQMVRRSRTTLILLGMVAGLLLRPGADVAATPSREVEELNLALAVSRTVARAAGRARPFVVSIRCTKPPVVENGKAKKAGEEGYGAGVLVRRDGMVLTSLHVVEGGFSLHVRLADGRELPAKIHAQDPSIDLALLKIDAPDLDLPAARLVDDSSVSVGETVLAIGNPYGLPGSVTTGVLSARGRRNVVAGNSAALLQTDAAINPGSSGGVLVNLKGEVIGLVNAILTKTGGDQGVGFAVPSSELRFALASMFDAKPVVRGWVGIHVATEGDGKEGVRVLSVVPDGPAAKAGVAKGDRIVRWSARRVRNLDDLRGLIRTAAAGERVHVLILRNGETRGLKLDVEELEK